MKPGVGPALGTLTEVRLNINKDSIEDDNTKTGSLTWCERIKLVALYALFLVVFILGIFGCYKLILATFNYPSYRKPGQSLEYHDLWDQNEKILMEIQRNHDKIGNLEVHLNQVAETKDMISSLQQQMVLLLEELSEVKEMKSEIGTLAKKIDDLREKNIQNDSGAEPLVKTRGNIILKNPSKSFKQPASVSLTSTRNNNTLIRPEFNVANVLIGASVDNELSSSSNLTSFFGGNQVGYVILDRQYLREYTAWCSTAEKPILTINLANYSKPTAVSYQHAEWEGAVPDETPKEYDVWGCLDSECINKMTIASNCKYLPSENQTGPEQKCIVNSYEDIPLINKVQFVFRSNHGNSKQTCVNLVRVYAEDHRTPEIKTEKQLKHIQRVELENERTCADWAVRYYDKKVYYPKDETHCAIIYSKNCCSVCPECCEECTMEDDFSQKHPVTYFGVGVLLIFLCFFAFLTCIAGICVGIGNLLDWICK